MAKLKIQHTRTGAPGYEASATIVEDSYVSPTTVNSTHIGGTGGDNDQTVPTIRIRYLRETTSAVDTGYIRVQKGHKEFSVNNTSDANGSVVTLVNVVSTYRIHSLGPSGVDGVSGGSLPFHNVISAPIPSG